MRIRSRWKRQQPLADWVRRARPCRLSGSPQCGNRPAVQHENNQRSMSADRQGLRLPATKARSEGLEKQLPFRGQPEPTAAVDRAGSQRPYCWAWLKLRRPICLPQKRFLKVSRSCKSHPILSVIFNRVQPQNTRQQRLLTRRSLAVSCNVVALTKDLISDRRKLLVNFDDIPPELVVGAWIRCADEIMCLQKLSQYSSVAVEIYRIFVTLPD